MKNDFQEAINEANAQREVTDNVIMDKITTMQAKYDNTLTELPSFTKGTFIVQDRVIKGLNGIYVRVHSIIISSHHIWEPDASASHY